MQAQGTGTDQGAQRAINWIFVFLFSVIGALNLLLIHPIPGTSYLLLAVAYLPFTELYLKKKLGFSIPFWVKIVFGFVVLWGTLAVGDLAEVFGL